MQPSCFVRRAAWEECGPLDEELHLAMDLDLWLKIANRFEFVLTQRNLSTSLVHCNAKTTALAAHSLVDATLVIMKHGGRKEARERLIGFVQDMLDQRARNLILHGQLEAAELLVQRNKEVLALAHEYENTINKLQLVNEQYEANLKELLSSHSWRITRPLRALGKVFHRLLLTPTARPPNIDK
jgi:hypothetical protein